ncbi:MAG: RNA polymerase sigma factor [Acidimicrobiia bacterium]
MSRSADGVLDRLDGLADGVRRRDPAAFRSVYELVADDLAGLAWRMLRDRHMAEDAVQQAFLELTKSASRFRGDGRALRAWLYRSVRYTCLDQLRRTRRRREEPVPAVPEPGANQVPEPEPPDPELEAALAKLSNRQRMVLHLTHVGGMPGDEVGRVMGLNRAAVYAIASRARARLRRELDRRGAMYPTGGRP